MKVVRTHTQLIKIDIVIIFITAYWIFYFQGKRGWFRATIRAPKSRIEKHPRSRRVAEDIRAKNAWKFIVGRISVDREQERRIGASSRYSRESVSITDAYYFIIELLKILSFAFPSNFQHRGWWRDRTRLVARWISSTKQKLRCAMKSYYLLYFFDTTSKVSYVTLYSLWFLKMKGI